MRVKRFVYGFLLLALAATAARGENWPGWRGPGRNGVSHEANLPLSWSETENVAWKIPLPGLGVAGPIVWDDRILSHRFRRAPPFRPARRVRFTPFGEGIVARPVLGTAPTLHHENKSSMATPVAVTDGKSVFSFFGTGDVFSTTVDGELVWHRSLAAEYGPFENRFAVSSSPLLFKNLVILQCDHYGASYVVAIDKATGANVWKVDRPGYWHSWASPQLVPAPSGSKGGEGRQELILCGSEKLDAFDPATGQKLWTVRGMLRECIPTPVFGDGLIYAVSGPKGPTLAVRPGGRGDVTDTRIASAPRAAHRLCRRPFWSARRTTWSTIAGFSVASMRRPGTAAGRSGCPAAIRRLHRRRRQDLFLQRGWRGHDCFFPRQDVSPTGAEHDRRSDLRHAGPLGRMPVDPHARAFVVYWPTSLSRAVSVAVRRTFLVIISLSRLAHRLGGEGSSSWGRFGPIFKFSIRVKVRHERDIA